MRPLHDVCRAIKASYDSGAVPQKADVKEWLDLTSEAAEAVNKRTFIIMTAQTRGWAFARKLDFYQSGKIVFETLATSKILMDRFVLGQDPDPGYVKVEDWMADRRVARRQKVRRPFRPYWGQPPAQAAPRSFGAAQGQGYGQPSWSPAASYGPRRPTDNSRKRCNTCHELGHLFRECPNGYPPM